MALSDLDVGLITNGTMVNGEWVGTGVFDKLLAAANKNIELQYTKSAISSVDYAAAYIAMLDTTMQQSLGYVTQMRIHEDSSKQNLTLEIYKAQLAVRSGMFKDKHIDAEPASVADVELDNSYEAVQEQAGITPVTT